MPTHLDDKQQRIITTWLQCAYDLTNDPYASFIALWISFNAFCYAQYAKDANRRRADLKKETGLRVLTNVPSRVEGTARRDGQRFWLKIENPSKISIDISERYTEDIIFSRFARQYRLCYKELLQQTKFKESVETFRKSLEKKNRWYVVNMARIDKYDPESDYKDMVKRNIIVPFDNCQDLNELKNALYQVRCNVFHGEKVPGDPNDDRIVKAAYPVLRAIMDVLVAKVVNPKGLQTPATDKGPCGLPYV